MVEEPTPAAAETILAGLMPRYERYHGVSIPPEAIHAAVELSVRYLPGRYLPDKAIDLLDEAAAARRIADASGNRRALTPADIARSSARPAGVPAERVGEAERERLANLEQRLAAEVIGQPAGRGRRGIRHSTQPHRPAGERAAHRSYAVPRGRRESARPSWHARWQNAGSAAKKPCCALTCRSIWSGIPSRGCSARRRAMSATTRAAS